jgi:hypothetical protein
MLKSIRSTLMRRRRLVVIRSIYAISSRFNKVIISFVNGYFKHKVGADQHANHDWCMYHSSYSYRYHHRVTIIENWQWNQSMECNINCDQYASLSDWSCAYILIELQALWLFIDFDDHIMLNFLRSLQN